MKRNRRETLMWALGMVSIPFVSFSANAKKKAEGVVLRYSCRFPREFTSLRECYDHYGASMKQYDTLGREMIEKYRAEGRVLRYERRLVKNVYSYEILFSNKADAEQFTDAYLKMSATIVAQEKNGYDFQEEAHIVGANVFNYV